MPADRQLQRTDAFLLGAVEIGVELDSPASCAPAMKASCSSWSVAQVGDAERAAGAVILVGAALLVLGLAEIRQHVVIGPAGIAELAPQVEILLLAADVDQAVDRGRPAEHLAARPVRCGGCCSSGTGSVSKCQVILGL